MEFEELLRNVGSEPAFETGLLLAGDVNPFDVRRQLSRWTAAGKIYQLRRGLYSLASPYRKTIPHPFLVANRLQPNSYVSLQSALAYYGLIPELVPITTSVATGRPSEYETPLGWFAYRHIRVNWFHGYQQVELGSDQSAFIARPEKALLDLVYLRPGGDAVNYLRSLRLQALDQLDLSVLNSLAVQSEKPKLIRAAKAIQRLVDEEAVGYHNL